MRRRNHGRLRSHSLFNARGNDHTLAIYRYRDGPYFQVSQYVPRWWISGILKPDAISRFQQGMTNQLHCVAISRCHEDLRWRASDPARDLEICRDLAT